MNKNPFDSEGEGGRGKEGEREKQEREGEENWTIFLNETASSIAAE